MKLPFPVLGLLLACAAPAWAADPMATTERIDQLETELEALRQDVEQEKSASAEAPDEEEATPDGIKIGGAMRLQYAFKDYDADDRDRTGDLDFDIFRLDLDGTIGNVRLSAQYRWFQYMDVVHHAYVAYQFSDSWEGQLGITKVPFGILDFNSNSFFFSTGFYVGLEDDYDAGVSFIGDFGQHDLRIAFFKNDEQGGLDGFVDNRTDRYAYDVVAVRDFNNADDGIFADPLAGSGLAEKNTLNLRYAYDILGANTDDSRSLELGVSLQGGKLEGEDGSAGDRTAYALHVKSQFDRVGVMFQFTDYEYDLDDDADFVAIGAYSFFDTMPAEAKLYNLNLSYSLPVKIGPITNLTFYNDYNTMTDKSGDLEEDTIMNVLGVAVTAGGIYAYVDLVTARNQPFVGGSTAGDDDDWNTRFNINLGYYF